MSNNELDLDTAALEKMQAWLQTWSSVPDEVLKSINAEVAKRKVEDATIGYITRYAEVMYDELPFAYGLTDVRNAIGSVLSAMIEDGWLSPEARRSVEVPVRTQALTGVVAPKVEDKSEVSVEVEVIQVPTTVETTNLLGEKVVPFELFQRVTAILEGGRGVVGFISKIHVVNTGRVTYDVAEEGSEYVHHNVEALRISLCQPLNRNAAAPLRQTRFTTWDDVPIGIIVRGEDGDEYRKGNDGYQEFRTDDSSEWETIAGLSFERYAPFDVVPTPFFQAMPPR